MEIKCIVTVKELKELLKKETPVAGTTDVKRVIEPVKNARFIDDIVQIIAERNSKSNTHEE